MFQTLQNVVHIDFELVPDGPVLVRSGTPSLDPGIADMEFQRTVHNGRRTVFLAGSGLKGVLRAHCERILNSAGRFACDPTRHRQDPKACSKWKLGRKCDREHPHAGQCSACFTFGSLELAGRFRVADAYPTEERWEETNTVEARTQVGLDRASQGPADGTLFNCEVVVSGAFAARVSGENFSLWQLGMVLQSLADLDDGLVRVGGAKARGMGGMKVQNPRIELRFLDAAKGKLAGARQHKDGNGYGLPPNDELPLPAGGEETSAGLFRVVRYRDGAVAALREALVTGALSAYLEAGRR